MRIDESKIGTFNLLLQLAIVFVARGYPHFTPLLKPKALKHSNKMLKHFKSRPLQLESHSTKEDWSNHLKPRCTLTSCTESAKTEAKPQVSLSRLPTRVRESNKFHFPKKKEGTNIKFSSKFDPETNSTDSGFVPILRPRGLKKTQRSTRKSPARRSRYHGQLLAKESKTLGILGNGNFEILRGGIFSDYETNEILGSRRVGRGFGNSFRPTEQRHFGIVQDFNFPGYFQGNSRNIPHHPRHFPRRRF